MKNIVKTVSATIIAVTITVSAQANETDAQAFLLDLQAPNQQSHCAEMVNAPMIMPETGSESAIEESYIPHMQPQAMHVCSAFNTVETYDI